MAEAESMQETENQAQAEDQAHVQDQPPSLDQSESHDQSSPLTPSRIQDQPQSMDLGEVALNSEVPKSSGGGKTPRYRRTKQYHQYTPEQKAAVAKFAVEHGNAKASSHFTEELGILVPESTIRTFKKAYYAKLSEGKLPDEITEIPLRRRGRPRRDGTTHDIKPAAVSSKVKAASKQSNVSLLGTQGFLDMTGEISMAGGISLSNFVSDLIAQADSAEKPLVLILSSTDGSYETKELASIATVKAYPELTDTSLLEDEDCSQVVAMMVGSICQINLALLSRCPKLRIVVRLGMGVDNVELEYAGRLGIIACNIPDYGIEEVADTAMAHILTLFRQTVFFHNKVQEGVEYGDIADIIASSKSRRVRGKTLGLVGLGKTGIAVAQRAKSFGFNVAFYDPFMSDGWDKALGGLERFHSLTDLVMRSDCVSLHCMLTEENRHMVNENLLRVFKRGAFLVNVSRGQLINEVALAKALKEGWIAGAALDVHEQEPFKYESSPLKGAPNLICTPHIAWYSKEGHAELRASGIKLVRQVITHSDPSGIQNCVNKQYLDNEACHSRWAAILN